MDYLRNRPDAKVTYHEPGEEPFSPRGVPNVRFYVLGPPRDESLLAKEDPSARGSEVYTLSSGLTLVDSFAAALLPHTDDIKNDVPAKVREREIASFCFPFDEFYRVDARDAKRVPYADFFREHYGGPKGKKAWRRIDEDWLSVADQLALNLDRVINNCSLVLAIELVRSKKVLLFVADAQVGNWLSWETVKWKTQEAGRSKEVSGHDLLERTVFYKVGHHGSHNATLQAQGLEIMASEGDLVAMIPVDETVVRQNGWEMPFQHMLERLEQRTGGRVFVAYKGMPDLNKVAEGRRAAFQQASKEDPLYVEYTVRG
jgi:hypothetical protein